MEARQRLVKDWITTVRTRQILLPRFQRFETWTPDTISVLLTSVLQDLPIGAALVLGVGGEVPFQSRPVATAPEEGDKVTELLLDGQQRVTALWRALHGNYSDRTYFVDLSHEQEPEVVAVTHWEKNGKRFPRWAEKPYKCWQRKHVPFDLLNPDNENEYQDWAETASDGEIALAMKIEHTITPLRNTVASYNLPYLYLPPDTPRDVAIDVFIKLNTQFVKLTAFDIVVAQLEAAVGEPLHEMVATLASEVPKLDDYAEPSDLVLAGGALLQERLPNQRGYLSLDLQQFSDDWPHLVTGAKGLVQFLEEEQVIDGARLPTQSVLAPLIALWSQAPESPDAKGNVRILLRKYLWSAFFTDRYDHSVPTSALQDYRALKSLVSDPSAAVSVPCLDRDEYPLPHEDLLMRARWPRYKDRLARALLLLSLRGGAEDLADGASVSRENIRQREYHHLFPIATMEDRELEEQDAHRALNCVLVTWRTNRKIAAKAPVTYLLERADASELGQTEIQRRLESHFLDYDLLSAGDYAAFLRGRAKACAKAIAQLCDGHCWHP